MQPVISVERKTLKKTKFATMYPKKLSTFIVAFAMNENMKTQSPEEVANETSFQNSKTVTPSTSTKTFTINNSKENIQDVLVAKDSMSRLKENCGDGEEEASNTLNNILNYLNINEVTTQPQVLFVAPKHTQKPKLETEPNERKVKKCKPVVLIKNIHFKNQHARNITSKLKRYCKKGKKTFDCSREIHREIHPDSISKRVSRTRVLKKVLAKENFLEKTESNIQNFTTCPIAGDSSFISNSSQGTLTRDDSSQSVTSIIEIKDPKITTYQTNIVNIAVAQISNTPNLKRKSCSVVVPHGEIVNIQDSFTSYESAFSQTLMLTSKSFLQDTIDLTSKHTISNASCSNSNISNETLIPPIMQSKISLRAFEVGNVLDAHEINYNMLSSCTPKCSFTNQAQHIKDITEKGLHTRTFFDACMTCNAYPKTRPCSSSVPDFPNNENVIIADDMLKTTQQIQKMKNRGDERYGNRKTDFRGNIFQKPFNVVNGEDYQKNLNLPNAAQIKSTMVDASRPQRKCSQEVNDYPSSFPELCDKLTIILEIAVKKLEQTLSEKIVNELKRSLYEIDKHINSITKFQENNTNECMTENMQLGPTKSKVALPTTPQTNAYLQCNILKNEVIDNLMLTFNEEHSKSIVQSSSSNCTHKLKKPKLVKDYLDILKNSQSSQYKEQVMGTGDSVQISIEDAVEEKIPESECKKTFWTLPVTILRENMFVVASVPAFLFVMFVIYSYIMLIIRMWWY